MEYLLVAAALAAFVLFVFVLESCRAKKAEKKFIRDLYQNYFKIADKKYSPERYAKIASFYLRHREDGQIDDITWNDLGMDELFKRMNYTLSASGEEYLYYTLRTLKQNREELEHFEGVVTFFGEHPDERVRFQFRMNQLGYTGKYSLYDYIDNLNYLGERSNKKHIIQDVLLLAMIGMLWVNFTAGILGIIVLVIYNIMTYFGEKSEIDPYITSFAYVLRLLEVCDGTEKLKLSACGEEMERIRLHRKKMKGMERNSFWVTASNRGGNAAGDVISMLMDYVRMIFHVDLMKFNSMLQFLKSHTEDVDVLITTLGYLESAVAVWIFRQSLENGWCRPEFTEQEVLKLREGYHPLLTSPVKNSIRAERGVLLTGSNASGKSTFLKTVAVNAILSQSVNTCVGDGYQASFFHVYSSMALRDDIEGGESYYIVEIRALKRILDAAASGERPVLCFVDEVLRGTNTVERIAASTQILRSLGGAGIFCFAATHDIELTGLLEGEFDNYHFEEEIREGDIFFSYRLHNGKATTRNAIRLLELMGYDDGIVEKAAQQAEAFLKTGEWRLC
ncbi:MAG: hypothetical protein NC541_15165 [bacterium]|nr:hypothetical protein [bacterium]